MTNLSDLARAVGDIARRAGAEIMRIYENEADFLIETKEDNSPLTRADRASNELIVRELGQLELVAPVISEESRQVPFSERSQYTRFWMVDPLDGTKEFIKRNGEFTVNIALVDTESPLLGVVYIPARDELYFAVRRHGAFRVRNGGEAERLEVAAFRLSDSGLRLVASRSHLNTETQTFIDQFAEPELVNAGSSLKLLMLAAGEAHIYPRLAPTMEWDICAAQIILEEAGGRVVDHETGRRLVYNKESLVNPYFVAYGGVRSEE